MIIPPDQVAIGQRALYLVQAQVFDEDTGNQLPGSEVQFANQVPGTSVIDVTNDDDSVWSEGLVSGAAGAQIEVTPATSVKNISFNGMGVYQLVSQCLATPPSNQARTNLGVGELVSIFFNPSPSTNVSWSTTAGSLLFTNGSLTIFTAPSNATNVTVTATVGGMPINFSYQVFAPTGYVRAQIYGTISAYQTNQAGAGMTNIIWIGPTNVSLSQVWMEEIGEVATNATGYFADTNTWPPSNLDHGQHGANTWFQLQDGNIWGDKANSGICNPPWTNGNFTWPIPSAWQVGSASSLMTNYIPGWNQNFTIDASGTVTIQKFGNSVTRTTNCVITTAP